MPRRSTKRFEYGKGIYYFNIRTSANNAVTIKRKNKKQAVDAFAGYLRTQGDKCEWLGKWDGEKFVDDDWEKISD